MIQQRLIIALCAITICFGISTLGWSQATIQAVPIRPATAAQAGEVASPAELEKLLGNASDAAAAAKVNPAAKPANQPDPEQERIKKLSALRFDRRPSAMLKAWSTPPEEDEPAEKDKPERQNQKKPSRKKIRTPSPRS